jgi:hypothetical protein
MFMADFGSLRNFRELKFTGASAALAAFGDWAIYLECPGLMWPTHIDRMYLKRGALTVELT